MQQLDKAMFSNNRPLRVTEHEAPEVGSVFLSKVQGLGLTV